MKECGATILFLSAQGELPDRQIKVCISCSALAALLQGVTRKTCLAGGH